MSYMGYGTSCRQRMGTSKQYKKAANNIKNDMDVYLKKYQRWIKKQLKNIHFDSVEIN